MRAPLLSGAATALRPLRMSDRAKSVQWRNDPEIRDGVLGYRLPITEAMEADWINAVLKDRSRARVILGIEDKRDGALVGFVYLHNIDWFARHAEFGILIGEPDRRGRGLAREALALVAEYAFAVLNMQRLHLRAVAVNKRALRLYRRFGFVPEGVLRRHAFLRGRYHDVVLMGLLRGEYKPKAAAAPSSR
jgi:RimJ/RimL family protein N-acetyltransferase